jgi:hypothetical protein
MGALVTEMNGSLQARAERSKEDGELQHPRGWGLHRGHQASEQVEWFEHD